MELSTRNIPKKLLLLIKGALIKEETVQETQNLLNVLPPDYRLAVILKYWYAMSYQEIAQTLETTVGAIKSKLFRARKMLAEKPAPAADARFLNESRAGALIPKLVL